MSGWMADAAPEDVTSRGLRNSAEKAGSVDDTDGVSGTGSEKILVRAWSPAVKNTVLSSRANYVEKYRLSHEKLTLGTFVRTAMEPTVRSQCWVRVYLTSFFRS